MPLDLLQKYDWTKVEAKLIYSIPEYLRTDDPNATGIVMLNKIVRDHFKKYIFGDLTIEYQVTYIDDYLMIKINFLGILDWSNKK